MTLHSLYSPAFGSIYWWYAAIPNERRGRAHLLQVPYFNIEPEKIIIPGWGVYDEDRYRARNSGSYIPSAINLSNPKRVCNARQRARRWLYEYALPTHVSRGVCKDCFEWQEAHGNGEIGWLAPNGHSRVVRALSTLTTEDKWVGRLKRQFYKE